MLLRLKCYTMKMLMGLWVVKKGKVREVEGSKQSHERLSIQLLR